MRGWVAGLVAARRFWDRSGFAVGFLRVCSAACHALTRAHSAGRFIIKQLSSLCSQVGDERNVLIFDLGGGTFDVSILTIEDGIFEVWLLGVSGGTWAARVRLYVASCGGVVFALCLQHTCFVCGHKGVA